MSEFRQRLTRGFTVEKKGPNQYVVMLDGREDVRVLPCATVLEAARALTRLKRRLGPDHKLPSRTRVPSLRRTPT